MLPLQPLLHSIVYGTFPSQGLFDALVVVPVHGRVDVFHDLPAGRLLPVLGVDRLRLHAAEESLGGGVVRGAAFCTHGSDDAMLLADAKPFGPPVVAATVGMHDGCGMIRQGGDGLPGHGVRQAGVRMQTSGLGDGPAVVAVDHRRAIHLAVTGFDLGDVRQPFHVGPCRGEVAVDQVVGGGRGLALVGTVVPSAGNMCHQRLPAHDPAHHLLRYTQTQAVVDPTVTVA